MTLGLYCNAKEAEACNLKSRLTAHVRKPKIMILTSQTTSEVRQIVTKLSPADAAWRELPLYGK